MKKILIIAEAGINHNGDIKKAIEMIKIAKESGADIIKFQTAIPELLSSKQAKISKYQKNFQKTNSSQLQMLKRLCLPLSDFKILKKECNKYNIEFLSTAFDNKSLEYLNLLKPKRFKIPSGEITNLPFIKKIIN